MNKKSVVGKIEKNWAEFNLSWEDLSESFLLEKGVTESWSIKDLIAHVGWWEEESLNYLPEILAGNTLPKYSVRYGGLDQFNALKTTEFSAYTLDEVKSYAAETHAALLAYLNSLDEAVFTTEGKFIRRLRGDTYGHYVDHTHAIQSWRDAHHLLNATEKSKSEGMS